VMRLLRNHIAIARSVIAIGALTLVHGSINAQDAATSMPDNAIATAYGKGWRCDDKFRDIDGICTRVVVPENAVRTNTQVWGSGWECAHGFALSRETCTRVIVPGNAYLESAGHG
jgi:hypothetical protein